MCDSHIYDAETGEPIETDTGSTTTETHQEDE